MAYIYIHRSCIKTASINNLSITLTWKIDYYIWTWGFFAITLKTTTKTWKICIIWSEYKFWSKLMIIFLKQSNNHTHRTTHEVWPRIVHTANPSSCGLRNVLRWKCNCNELHALGGKKPYNLFHILDSVHRLSEVTYDNVGMPVSCSSGWNPTLSKSVNGIFALIKSSSFI